MHTSRSYTRYIALFLLIDFTALNLYALYATGVGGLFSMLAEAGPWLWVLGADLLIALGMVCAYMWHEARQSGKTPLGYIILTLLTGSIGPLLYLVRRPHAPTTPQT